MVRIVVNGALGHMGREVLAQASIDPAFVVVAGFDPTATEADASGLRYPLLPDITTLREPTDVIIDFSHPSALPALLQAVSKSAIPLILGTTGYSNEDRKLIEEVAQTCPVFLSPNMSYGIAVLSDLARQARKALGRGYDVEIVEAHHRQKLDAPSGTALLLAEVIADTSPEPMPVVVDRPAIHQRRGDQEIGVVAIRGGTVPGEHTVGFYGDDETIELRHSAGSRRILAAGALRAASWMVGKEAGLYVMRQLLAEQSLVTHIGVDEDVAVLSLSEVSAAPDDLTALFAALGDINVDMISATTPRNGYLDLAFSVPQADLPTAVQALEQVAQTTPRPRITEHLAKLTVEGEGMAISPGVTGRVFRCLSDCAVSPCQVTTSETKITMAIEADHVSQVIAAIRQEFGLV